MYLINIIKGPIVPLISVTNTKFSVIVLKSAVFVQSVITASCLNDGRPFSIIL